MLPLMVKNFQLQMDKLYFRRSFITIGTVPPSSGLLIPYSPTSLRPFEQRFSWRSFGHVAIRKFNGLLFQRSFFQTVQK